jgi:hypothetical protein
VQHEQQPRRRAEGNRDDFLAEKDGIVPKLGLLEYFLFEKMRSKALEQVVNSKKKIL